MRRFALSAPALVLLALSIAGCENIDLGGLPLGQCQVNGEYFDHVTNAVAMFEENLDGRRTYDISNILNKPKLQVRKAPRPALEGTVIEFRQCVIRKSEWPEAERADLGFHGQGRDIMTAHTPRGQTVEVHDCDIDHWALASRAIWE